MSDQNAQAKKDADAMAAKAREEARTGGTNAPATPEMMQKIRDMKASEAAKSAPTTRTEMGKKFASGGSVSSASKRADGCVTKGKTRGKMV